MLLNDPLLINKNLERFFSLGQDGKSAISVEGGHASSQAGNST